jgi:hypothetical protein
MRLEINNKTTNPKGDRMKDIMAGIDLHSNNLMLALMDSNGSRLFHKRLDCELDQIDQALRPYQKRIDTVAVESTFNWYWLVDGLQDLGYTTVLANPAGIQQYQGIKHTDDKHDAYWLSSQSLATGKANFTLEAKYKKTTSLEGHLEFEFNPGRMKFRSVALDWMVVSEPRVQIKGMGTFGGKTLFLLLVTAIDSRREHNEKPRNNPADRLRLNIWDESGVVYDNQRVLTTVRNWERPRYLVEERLRFTNSIRTLDRRADQSSSTAPRVAAVRKGRGSPWNLGSTTEKIREPLGLPFTKLIRRKVLLDP